MHSPYLNPLKITPCDCVWLNLNDVEHLYLSCLWHSFVMTFVIAGSETIALMAWIFKYLLTYRQFHWIIRTGRLTAEFLHGLHGVNAHNRFPTKWAVIMHLDVHWRRVQLFLREVLCCEISHRKIRKYNRKRLQITLSSSSCWHPLNPEYWLLYRHFWSVSTTSSGLFF